MPSLAVQEGKYVHMIWGHKFKMLNHICSNIYELSLNRSLLSQSVDIMPEMQVAAIRFCFMRTMQSPHCKHS